MYVSTAGVGKIDLGFYYCHIYICIWSDMTKRPNRANNLTTFGGCRIIMYLSYEWKLSLTMGALYIVLRKIWNDGKLAIRKSRARIQDDVYERQEKKQHKQIKQYDNGDDDEDD